MGASKRKKARILSTAELCYFCANRAPETADHVPSRACFVDRIGPEGFEFPACQICNQITKGIEQVVAYYLLILDRNTDRQSEDEMWKQSIGMHNNFPKLMPNMDHTANEKRKAFNYHSSSFRTSSTFSEEPIISIPKVAATAFDIWSFKLGSALYYKHSAQPISGTRPVTHLWLPFTAKATTPLVEHSLNMLPGLQLGTRVNTDIGDQFAYRYGLNEDKSMFAFTAQMRKSGYVFFALGPDGSEPYSSKWTTVENRRRQIISGLEANPHSWSEDILL